MSASREEFLYVQAVQAMIYGWPLYEMQRMRAATSPRRVPNKGFAGAGPESTQRWCNTFIHARELLRAGGSRVVMPNNDTLYTNAWLDLSGGPLVLDLPDMGQRYHVLGFLDFFTNPFAHVGTRTTGNGAKTVLILPPGWMGQVPAALQVQERLLQSPTPWVWIIGRLLIDGPQELEAVHALQDHFRVRTLADWLQGQEGEPLRFDAKWDAGAPFETLRFLHMVNAALRENPAPAGDEALIASCACVGLGVDEMTLEALWQQPGIASAWVRASLTVHDLLDQGADALGQLTPAAGWSRSMMSLSGGFGHDHLLRAFVARQGIGALAPQEAIYPRCETDSEGQRLTGARVYRLRFEPGQLPPVHAFWSITLYDAGDYMLVDNLIDRYAIGDRTPGLVSDPDGGLTLYIQHQPPLDTTAQANWLPAPKGEFFLCLRAYMPAPHMLDGRYSLPAPQCIAI